MKTSGKNLVEVLKNGGVAVMPTDTIYGIVGKAENAETVERIYKIRKRPPDKPCIILISGISELSKFGIVVRDAQKKMLNKNWPGPVSIILDCKDAPLSYLHRGTNTLAFRVPASESLQKLLKETGPLIAPSANPHGLPPATNISEAKKYFGDQVNLYMDGGTISGSPSKILRLHPDASVTMVRE